MKNNNHISESVQNFANVSSVKRKILVIYESYSSIALKLTVSVSKFCEKIHLVLHVCHVHAHVQRDALLDLFRGHVLDHRDLFRDTDRHSND